MPFFIEKKHEGFQKPFLFKCQNFAKKNTNTNYRIYFLSQKNHSINYLGENSYDTILELLWILIFLILNPLNVFLLLLIDLIIFC
jgi:hypothetical protein